MSAQASQSRYQNPFVVSIAIMLVATSLTAMQYKLPTIIPVITAQGLMDLGTATLLMSIFTFVGIFFALPAGMLVQKIGAKKAMLLAVAMDCIATVGIFFDNTVLLVFFRVLEGMALILVVVSGPVIVQQHVEPGKRGMATGIWILGGMLGAFIAGIATPSLFELGSLQGVWVGYSIFVLLTGVALFFMVKDGSANQTSKAIAKDQAGEKSGVQAASDQPRITFATYRPLLKPNMLLFFVSFTIFQLLLLTTLSFSPSFLQQKGFDPTLSGLVSTLPMLLSIISSVAFGAIADKTGRFKLLYIIGLAAMSICVFLMFQGTGILLWVAVLLMGLVALGAPAVAVSAYPLLINNPKIISIGMGLLVVLQSLGQFLGTVVPSALLGPDLDQWLVMTVVVLGIGVVGTISALLCKFNNPKNE